MHGIKAFVGHSFAESDRDVVAKFLEHFRTLAKVYRLTGSYERKSNGLGVLSSAFGMGNPPQVTHHKIEYSGRLWGQTIIGTVTKSHDGQQLTLLEGAGNNAKVLMYFGLNGQELHVIENPHSSSPSFSVIRSLA